MNSAGRWALGSFRAGWVQDSCRRRRRGRGERRGGEQESRRIKWRSVANTAIVTANKIAVERHCHGAGGDFCRPGKQVGHETPRTATKGAIEDRAPPTTSSIRLERRHRAGSCRGRGTMALQDSFQPHDRVIDHMADPRSTGTEQGQIVDSKTPGAGITSEVCRSADDRTLADDRNDSPGRQKAHWQENQPRTIHDQDQ